jgi:hypothetical protein
LIIKNILKDFEVFELKAIRKFIRFTLSSLQKLIVVFPRRESTSPAVKDGARETRGG